MKVQRHLEPKRRTNRGRGTDFGKTKQDQERKNIPLSVNLAGIFLTSMNHFAKKMSGNSKKCYCKFPEAKIQIYLVSNEIKTEKYMHISSHI